MFNNNDSIKVYVAKTIYSDEFLRLNILEGMTCVFATKRAAIKRLYDVYRDDCFVWEMNPVSEEEFDKDIEDYGCYIKDERVIYSLAESALEIPNFLWYEIYRREKIAGIEEDIRCRYNGEESDIRDVARLVDHALDQNDTYNDVYWSTIEYFANEAGLKEIED